MNSSLLHAFDALAPHAEVSAALCATAAQGRLDLPSDVHTICTRAGLPRARAGDIERVLSVGRQLGLFGQVGPLSWRSCDPNPELVRIRSRDFRLIEVSTLAAGQVLARVFSRCLPLQRGVGTNLVIVRPPGVDFLLGVGK